MNRRQILWLEGWIAFSGGVFWYLPPNLPYTAQVVAVSTLWSLLALGAIRFESLESWSHRVSAFAGFLLGTVEGMLGLLGLTAKGGLLLMAALHGFAFILSVVGKYTSHQRRRPPRKLDEPTSTP